MRVDRRSFAAERNRLEMPFRAKELSQGLAIECTHAKDVDGMLAGSEVELIDQDAEAIQRGGVGFQSHTGLLLHDFRKDAGQLLHGLFGRHELA